MGKIWVGTSGYNYKHWREVFYPKGVPQKKWLEFYSEHFKTVEINATFYGSFKAETFIKWKKQTPSDFTFVLKGPRYITHIKRLLDPEESIERFFGSARALSEKLKVILWQFPPNFINKEENLELFDQFLKALPKNIKQVFEFRHKTWFTNVVYELLDQNKAGIVISESGRFPSEDLVLGGICYIRFHGPSGLYSSEYSVYQLKSWAKKINKWSKKADVYCYFNNDVGGFAIKNAMELGKILDQK